MCVTDSMKLEKEPELPYLQKFREACYRMLVAGIFPSPKKIKVWLGRIQPDRVYKHAEGGPTLNGEETRIRNELLVKFGYAKDANTGRWKKDVGA